MFTPSARSAQGAQSGPSADLLSLSPLSELAVPATGATPPLPGDGGGLRRLASQSLFQGRQELLIDHGEAVYRLRITSQGKLILTK